MNRTTSQTTKPAGIGRRHFLKASALAIGAFHFVPSGVLDAPGQPGANSRFVIAQIGVGGMGKTHLNNLLRFQDEGKVHIAAVCDCDENRLKTAFQTTKNQATPYRDYRYILERKDIDCVLIATPDHGHAVPTVVPVVGVLYRPLGLSH